MLHVPAAMALLSLPVCLYYGEYAGVAALATTLVVGVACGQALYWPARGRTPVQRRHAMVIAALAWLAVAVVGAVPFVASGQSGVLDGLFESMSGFTTTGMTVLQPAEMPHYLQWWRSLSQWVGGVGVMLLMLSILPPQRGALELYYSEARAQKLLPSVRDTARMVWSIYGLFTGLSMLGLWLAGAPGWQAINHGMAGIATGGFTITPDGLAGAGTSVKLVYVVIMLAGALSFHTHYRVWRERSPRPWWRGSEYRLFWTVIVAGGALIMVQEAWNGQLGPDDSLLRWVAAVTTTGALGEVPRRWPAGTLWLLMLAMCMGGIAGSTTGGIKMLRLVTLYRSLVWGLADLLRQPHEVLRLTFDGQALSARDAQQRVRAAVTLVSAWVIVALVGVWAMSWCVPADTPLADILFDVLSAQSSEGVTTGLVDARLSAAGKGVLMTLMWMGRLEIMPVLVLAVAAMRRFGRV